MTRLILVAAALGAALSVSAAAQPPRALRASIQVLDDQGRPMSGGVVFLDTKRLGETDSDGCAYADSVQVRPGLALITYVEEGFLAARPLRVRDDDDSVQATVRLGELAAEGQVVRSDGGPVPGAQIKLQETALGRCPCQCLHADAQGRFRLDGYCLDASDVSAQAEGLMASDPQRLADPFPASMRFTLFREASVTLTLTDMSGVPLPGISCDYGPLVPRSGPIAMLMPMARTDSQGQAEIEGLRPGRFWVLTYEEGYQPELHEGRVGDGERADVRWVYRRQALPMASVAGIVVGPDGRTPIPNASVSLTHDDEDAWGLLLSYSARTDPEGRFEARAPLGHHRAIQVSKPGYVAPQGDEFDLTGPIAGIRLQLFRGGRVEALVRAADGSPPPEGAMAFCGYRAAPVSPDTGLVVLEPLPPGPAEMIVRFPDHVPATARFVVPEGGVVRAPLRYLPEVTIVGKLVDRRDGEPIPMAAVFASRDQTPEIRGTVTEDDGRFRLAAMSAGRISLSAWLPGYSRAEQTLEAPDAGTYAVTLETSPGGRVEGELAPGLFGPDARAVVTLGNRRERTFAAFPDPAGHFVFTHVPPGAYSLTAKALSPGAQATAPIQITVAEGETTGVVVEGRSEGTEAL